MFLEHPVSGVGAGQWKVEYPGTGLRGTNESVMNGSTTILRPHNDVLWMLSELGIFGALAFVALLFLGFMGNVKGGQNLYMALVVVGFAVYGLGEFPVERTTMLIPLALALATASASQKSIFNLPYSAPLLVLCLSFSFGVGTQRVHGEREAKGALQGYLNRNAKDMLSYSVSAENAFFEMDIYNNPMAYFEAIGFLTTGGQQPSQGLVNKAKSGFERALSVHPNHMLSMNQLANIHRMQGDLEQAAELYYKVLEMSPRNTTAALRLVELERSKGDLYASLNALKMLSTQHTPQNLNGLGQEATKTLMAFSRLENVRPALASLHEQLKGAPAGKMWSIWSKWREK
jgi:tetratricopeptide (TPR) repeat protein